MSAREQALEVGRGGVAQVVWIWGLVSLGALHVWRVIGKGLATSYVWSPFLPLLGSLLVLSLDLSELAKAAKKKLQAVSLLPFLPPRPRPRPSDRSPFL